MKCTAALNQPHHFDPPHQIPRKAAPTSQLSCLRTAVSRDLNLPPSRLPPLAIIPDTAICGAELAFPIMRPPCLDVRFFTSQRAYMSCQPTPMPYIFTTQYTNALFSTPSRPTTISPSVYFLAVFSRLWPAFLHEKPHVSSSGTEGLQGRISATPDQPQNLRLGSTFSFSNETQTDAA